MADGKGREMPVGCLLCDGGLCVESVPFTVGPEKVRQIVAGKDEVE